MDTKLILSLLLVILVSKTCEGRPSTYNVSCNQAADIIFAVDTSSSIWPGFFNDIKIFLKDVISSFNIGPGPLDSRVGILLFSTREYLEFHLNRYKNKPDLMKAVENIKFRRGDTYTDRALGYVCDEMLTPEHGSREGVAKLVVVLTDGKSVNAKKTVTEAARIKAKGADILAIGVGNGVDFQELSAMASPPSHQFVFNVTDFRALDSIKKAFAQTTCEVLISTSTPTAMTSVSTTTTTTTTTTAAPTTRKYIRTTTTTEKVPRDQPIFDTGCEGKAADIYFLLDASSSVWINHFHDRVLPFVRDLVSSFQISPLYTRVGLATFSNNVNNEFGLDAHDNLKSLLAAIQPEHIDYLTGATNTGEAIEYVTVTGFGPGQARKDVAQVMITLTDGLSQEPLRTAQAAEKAKKNGIYMFAVGVGNDIDEKELSDISSNPDDDFVFHVDDFTALPTITKLLALKTCKAVSDENKPSELAQCSEMSSNVVFVYDYIHSVSSSKLIVEELISQFAYDVAAAAPRVSVGIVTQPCVGGTTSLQNIGSVKRALANIRGSYYVTYPQLVSQLRIEIFSSVPRTEQRVAVIIVDDSTRDLDVLQKEVKLLKFSNVKVIVVAVGKVEEAVVQNLASAPIKEHVLRVDSYSDMKDAKLDILNILCKKYSQGIFGLTEPAHQQETTTLATGDDVTNSISITGSNEQEHSQAPSQNGGLTTEASVILEIEPN